jgi:hypothetical protein
MLPINFLKDDGGERTLETWLGQKPPWECFTFHA